MYAMPWPGSTRSKASATPSVTGPGHGFRKAAAKYGVELSENDWRDLAPGGKTG